MEKTACESKREDPNKERVILSSKRWEKLIYLMSQFSPKLICIFQKNFLQIPMERQNRIPQTIKEKKSRRVKTHVM